MNTSQAQILSAGDMSLASFVSKVVDLGNVNLGSIQAVWAGVAPVGVLKIQLSNDIISNTADPNVAVVNWDDFSGSSFNVSGNAGTHIFNISNMGYKWLRLFYTRTGGTGSMDANMTAKDA